MGHRQLARSPFLAEFHVRQARQTSGLGVESGIEHRFGCLRDWIGIHLRSGDRFIQ